MKAALLIGCLLLAVAGHAAPGEGTRVAYGTSSKLTRVLVVDGALGASPAGLSCAALTPWMMWQAQDVKDSGCDAGRITNRSRFGFGGGLRFSQLFQGTNAVFEGRAAAKGQELVVMSPLHSAINLAMQVRLKLVNVRSYRHPLYLGFNIDLVGVSFGPARATRQPAYSTDFNTTARPVPVNVLLGNINDRGTLNSEFYLAYKAASRLTVRAGLAHIASGYALDGNRYQRFSNLGFVGVTYTVGDDWRSY